MFSFVKTAFILEKSVLKPAANVFSLVSTTEGGKQNSKTRQYTNLSKEYGSWCNWKFEERKKGLAKVPYNPKTGNHIIVQFNEKSLMTMSEKESMIY